MVRNFVLVLMLFITITCTPETPCKARVTDNLEWTSNEVELVELINDYRSEKGLVELVTNEDLKIESDNRAKVMYYLDAITHDGVDVVFINLESKCYSGVREILGGGYTTINTVIAAWKNSSSHNRALINPDSRYVSATNIIGRNGQTIYVVVFAK